MLQENPVYTVERPSMHAAVPAHKTRKQKVLVGGSKPDEKQLIGLDQSDP